MPNGKTKNMSLTKQLLDDMAEADPLELPEYGDPEPDNEWRFLEINFDTDHQIRGWFHPIHKPVTMYVNGTMVEVKWDI
jgi:hypothetical protein